MKGFRRCLVACLVAGALVTPVVTAQPIDNGAVPAWRVVLAPVESFVARMLHLISGVEEVAPEKEGGADPFPPPEQGLSSEDLSSSSGQNEVLPSFDPDG